MTKEEVMQFISQIKKDYSSFEIKDEDEYQVWKNALMRLSKDVVLARYAEHKENTNYKKNPPDIKLFLFSEKESIKNKKFLMKCEFCGKIAYYDAMQKHMERHNSIRYMKTKGEKYFNHSMSPERENEFLLMKQDEFDSIYYNFLLKLIPLTTGLEHEILINIKFTKENPGIPLAVNLNETKKLFE